MTATINIKQTAKIKNSTNFRKRTVKQPFEPYFGKTNIMFSFNYRKVFFSVGMLNNVTIYKKKHKQQQKMATMHKNQKLCMKTRSTKSKKTFFQKNRPQK